MIAIKAICNFGGQKQIPSDENTSFVNLWTHAWWNTHFKKKIWKMLGRKRVISLMCRWTFHFCISSFQEYFGEDEECPLRIGEFIILKGFAHEIVNHGLFWTLGKGILGYLALSSTLLIIYFGLTINAGYPYIDFSNCMFLNPGKMFLFSVSLIKRSTWPVYITTLALDILVLYLNLTDCAKFWKVFFFWVDYKGKYLFTPVHVFSITIVHLYFSSKAEMTVYTTCGVSMTVQNMWI